MTHSHGLKSEVSKTKTIDDPGRAWREVDFFLRLHRHLPDDFCGRLAIGGCKYRPDGIAINAQNDYVKELQKDPEFVKKEKEVEEAVKKHWNKKVAVPPIAKAKGIPAKEL